MPSTDLSLSLSELHAEGLSRNPLEASWGSLSAEREQTDKIWREPPVDILTFCHTFLNRTNLSEFHRDLFSAYAGGDPAQWDERFKLYALCWGLGSGKNFATEVVVAYTLYRLMLLVNPRRFFGLDEAGFIDILNISFISEIQAQQVFFKRLQAVIRATIDPCNGMNWFAQRGVDLREGGSGDLQEKLIELPRGVRVRCLPFTSTGFEGSDIALAVIDEPSRAVQSPPANVKAHKLLSKILDNTTARFGMKGKVIMFSYPEAQDGDLITESFNAAGTQFTMAGRRTRTGDKIESTWYGSLGATYEVNPRRKREDFDHQRKTDPEGVATRIDCQPPHSRTGFYRAHPEKIAESFKGIDPHYAAFTYEIVPNEYRVQSEGRLVTRTYTGIRLVKAVGDDEPRVLGGDPGESGDIFALALARSQSIARPVQAMVIRREREEQDHPPGVTPFEPRSARMVDRATNLTTELLDRSVVVDGIAEIVPIRSQPKTDPKTGRTVTETYPISFISVVEFIIQLKFHFPNLHLAAFDRWSSNEMIEELISKGNIDARSLTFSNMEQYALYAQHRSLAYNDLVKCVPCPRAEKEFVDLQEVTPGRKVDHKPDGGKDVSDAIVIACHLALELGIEADGSYVLR